MMLLTKEKLKTLFQNGHRAEDGVANGKCQFCGLAQNYWNKWHCLRLDRHFDKKLARAQS